MRTVKHVYHHDQEELHGFIAYDENSSKSRPAVIVVHDWTGSNEFARNKAEMLAEMGYLGFALDMYGEGRTGNTNEEKMALMNPLITDRIKLKNRVKAAFDTVAAMPEVDENRIAIIGFCFGGLCALDFARSGADLKGVVSFHGLLKKPEHVKPEAIKAKILVLHGYNDPMVSPADVNNFCQEMTEANVDWQVQMYGRVQHSFTNPQAHDENLGLMYNDLAAKRSWQAMSNFLQELF